MRTAKQRFVRLGVFLVGALVLGAMLSGGTAIFLVTRPQHRQPRSSLARYYAELRAGGAARTDEITITVDGARLVGTLARPAANDRHEVVLLVHGLGADRTDLVGVATLLLTAGYTTLSVDERAHGESTGSAVTFGVLEHVDLEKWIDWLHKMGYKQCVHGYGLSMGASSLIMAAADGAQVCSVWADSAYASFEDVAIDQAAASMHLGPALGSMLARPATMFGFLVARVLRGVDLGKADPVRVIANVKAPLMLVQGDHDTLVRPSSLARLTAAKPNAMSWMVPGAGHVQARKVAGQNYDSRLLEWLASAAAH